MGHENSAKYGEDHCPALGLRILGYGGAPRPHRSIETETNKSNTNSISERVDDIGEGGDGADELWIALDV